MTEPLTLLISLALPVVALVVIGRKRDQPTWITAGTIAGFLVIAIGIVWAANIGADALWATMIAAFGVALWGQFEWLWWRRGGR
jgi:hypothetical protein